MQASLSRIVLPRSDRRYSRLAPYFLRGVHDANDHHRQCRQQGLHEPNRLDRYIAYIIETYIATTFCFCCTMATYSPSPTFYEAAGYLSNASSLSNVSSSVKLEVAKPFPQILSAIRDPNLCAFTFSFMAFSNILRHLQHRPLHGRLYST